MSKKNIYLIIALVLIILAVFSMFLVYSKIEENRENLPVPIEEEKTPEIKENEIIKEEDIVLGKKEEKKYPYQLAKETGDVEECMKIEDKEYQNKCVILLADYLKDIDVCSVLDDSSVVRKCLDGVMYEKAMDSLEIALCEGIENKSLNGACIVNIIAVKKDRKPSDCNGLSENGKNYCLGYFHIAEERRLFDVAKSKDECERITDFGMKLGCFAKF